MVRGEVDAEASEAFVQLRVVGVADDVETDLVGVGTPGEKQVDEIPPPHLESCVEGGLLLHGPVIAVRDEEKHERVVLPFERDCQGGLDAARAAIRRACGELEGATLLNPDLDVIEAFCTAETMELLQCLRVRRTSHRWARVLGIGVPSRIDEGARHLLQRVCEIRTSRLGSIRVFLLPEQDVLSGTQTAYARAAVTADVEELIPHGEAS
jgi:hypothetical protein